VTTAPSGTTRPHSGRQPTALDALAERHLEAASALDPIEATITGLRAHEDRMTDFSPEGHGRRADLARATLRELAGLSPADPVDAVTAAALREQLSGHLELHEAGLDLCHLNNIASPVQLVREVFDVAPTATAADWQALSGRLHAVGDSLAGYRRSLTQARATGWVPAARQVRVAAVQAAQFGRDDTFFGTFAAQARTADGAPLPAGLAADVGAGARAACAAYRELASWLTSSLLTDARPDDAVGRERYALYARGFLGPAIAVLDADPARVIEGAEPFREWMQELSDRAVRSLDGDHFDIPAPVRTLACRIAPSSSGAVYYTGPSEDFVRPGQMWWSVPPGVTRFSTWRETSTVFHEGVPGHHLQLGQVAYRSDLLNRWRRFGLWVSGHGEGWALYAERLMEELGHLTDPGDLLGMLDAHALRASRVVVDIGVHCGLSAPAELGGGRWDADKAWAFLTAHSRLPEPNRAFELDRYLGWPGQAISYKLGERVWLDLRREVAARQGAAFDLKAFHRRALDIGSVGLDTLRTAVLADV
jgi:uncharacterized protein (DUF885 family)